MEYYNIKHGVFLSRPNRFLAKVIVEGKEETVHVKNTGRLKELLISGTEAVLEESNKPNRKTKYSLIGIYKGKELVNIDSQAPNAAVFEAVKNGRIKEIGLPQFVKREVKYGDSRFDIYYERDGVKGFAEVKGVNLDVDGIAKFPDAPTERGSKHLRELIRAHEKGYECSVLFVIQMKGIKAFMPNAEMDKSFAASLMAASKAGVNVLAYDCSITESSMTLDKKIDVIL